MPTVTIDAAMLSRLQRLGTRRLLHICPDGECGHRDIGLEPGDLDLVEPEPSVAEMLDALIADDRPGYGREVEITENRMGGSVKVYRWFDDDDEGWKAVAGKHGIDWRDALRAVYQQKVNETCRQ